LNSSSTGSMLISACPSLRSSAWRRLSMARHLAFSTRPQYAPNSFQPQPGHLNPSHRNFSTLIRPPDSQPDASSTA
jgi:hypothetical protein